MYIYIYAVSALAALFDREQIIIFTVNTWLRFALLSIVEHEMNMELTLTQSITEWRLGPRRCLGVKSRFPSGLLPVAPFTNMV